MLITTLPENWKKELAEILRKLGIIHKDFTGKIILNFSQGALCEAEKTAKIK